MPNRPLLFVEDVQAIWTEERRAVKGSDAPEVKPNIVHDYKRFSQPAAPGKPKNRYQDDPMPYPRASRGAKLPAWNGDQEQDLRAWYRKRLGLLKVSDYDSESRRAHIAELIAEEEKRVVARIDDWAEHTADNAD
ncbi:hypothetical protein [Actinoplanes sp. URMC 104]|uniref:hypothetical protein n=1 Tax=Actinoplanes sp. URMC 104 TaxID=3423409 RepID=UPI003F19BD99